MKLSKRIKLIKPSPTMALVSESAALRDQGVDVISCGVGEPDFDTPQHIKDAANEALRLGFTKYTPVPGTLELRSAIAEKLVRENGLTGYDPKTDICVTCGGKQALFNAFLALLDPGDEVVIPAPYWVSYPEMVSFAGGRPVVAETPSDGGFKLTPERLSACMSPKTRAVILNSPSNPAGVTYSTEELRGLSEVLRGSEAIVISDDVYERILYVPRPLHIGVIAPELRDRLLIVNSVSKTYAMTGWRIGYAVGPAPLIEAMVTLQGQSTSNATSVAQMGALAAFRGPQSAVDEMVSEFAQRRSALLDRLTEMEGVDCLPPEGSFYAFVDVSRLFGRPWRGGSLRDSDDVARFFLADAHVAVVGGGGFGSRTHVRLSFAVSMEKLQEALDRLEASIGRL